MISTLCHQAAASNDLLTCTAKQYGVAIAGAIFIIHGGSATYQVGWSDDLGRDVNASYKVLYDAALHLKDKGIKYLDLGGVNDTEAAGVKKFKSGMGGELVELVGQYK